MVWFGVWYMIRNEIQIWYSVGDYLPYAIRPRTMMAKTPWTTRRGKIHAAVPFPLVILVSRA